MDLGQVKWILDVDIRSYFDTLDHAKLREIVSQRVQDGVVRRLIGKWLKAGVMEAGSLSYRDQGTPQGGVISPMLSNIYLQEVLVCPGSESAPQRAGFPGKICR
jgi:RNA-directed DNA polymerase